MPSTQHHIEYPPPLSVGPPSPATSVGSRHPDDTTSTSDSENVLPQPLFERKWADKIGLGHPREEELRANKEPLLTRPPQDSDEERQLFGAVLQNLRNEVRALGEDEIFQRTLLRGMMNPPSTRAEPQPSFPKPQCTPGPWNTNETRHGFGAGLDSVPGSGSTTGRRTKGRGASSRRVP